MTTQTKKRKHETAARHQTGEVMTIAWMLTVFTTLTCEVVALGCNLYLGVTHRHFERLTALADVLVLAGVVTGLVGLLLTGIVLKMRKTPPPRGILVFAVAVCFAPLLMAIALANNS